MNKNWKILLLSYHKPSMDWLIKYLRKNNVKKISYIMNAAKPNVAENPNFVFNDRNRLLEAGFNVDVVNLDEVKDFKTFDDTDVVYARGGNTFCLLDSIRNSGFDKYLPKLLDEGKIYVSSSAGSIVLSPSIEIVENDFMTDENVVGIKDKSGLNMINFAVFPHWEEKWRKQLERLIEDKNIKYPVITLNDKQAVLIEDGKSKVITIN